MSGLTKRINKLEGSNDFTPIRTFKLIGMKRGETKTEAIIRNGYRREDCDLNFIFLVPMEANSNAKGGNK